MSIDIPPSQEVLLGKYSTIINPIPPMLSDTACKNAKAKEKPYKIADVKGMFLLVNPNGSKYFRFKYRIDGKEKTLALGVYSESSLKQARDKRDEACQQLADGIDPSENRKAVKLARADSAGNSFEIIARKWFERNMSEKSDSHRKRTLSSLECDVFPYVGSKPNSAPILLSIN